MKVRNFTVKALIQSRVSYRPKYSESKSSEAHNNAHEDAARTAAYSMAMYGGAEGRAPLPLPEVLPLVPLPLLVLVPDADGAPVPVADDAPVSVAKPSTTLLPVEDKGTSIEALFCVNTLMYEISNQALASAVWLRLITSYRYCRSKSALIRGDHRGSIKSRVRHLHTCRRLSFQARRRRMIGRGWAVRPCMRLGSV